MKRPETAIQFLDLVVEVGDVPEKEEFLRRIRQINGHTDPDAKLTPEEEQAQQQKQEDQAKMKAFTEAMALLEKSEKEATIRKINAEAGAKEADAVQGQPDVQGMLAEQQQALTQQFTEQIAAIQQAADEQQRAFAEQVAQLKLDAGNRMAEAEAKGTAEHRKAASEIVRARIARAWSAGAIVDARVAW